MTKYHLFLAICLLTVCGNAQSNLITNGGFESPNVQSGWKFGPDSNGWQGSNIEVWASGFNGVASYEGTQHGELNAHPYDGSQWDIYQSFDTTIDELYKISFAYSARRNATEAFRFLLVDDVAGTVFDKIIDDHITNHWEHFSGSFWGTGNEMTLSFKSITPRLGTVGNFLDAVEVVSVPEPGVISLFGLGLLGMGFIRRRARN